MIYYIRKEWKNNLIVIILTIVCVALQISVNLLTMRSAQSIIDLNWGRFLGITLVELCCWLLNFLLQGLGINLKPMQNELRKIRLRRKIHPQRQQKSMRISTSRIRGN